MAEAVIHAVTVHPCAHCAGVCRVEERAWRTPMCLVHCLSCGNLADGDSVAEAVAAWDAANPAREVSDAERVQASSAYVKPLLTPLVLAALTEAAETYALSGEPQTVDGFLAWCLTLAGA